MESLTSTGDDARGCPPHHWRISTTRRDGTVYYHHLCVRCAAEKDVPALLTTSRWLRSSAAVRRPAGLVQPTR